MKMDELAGGSCRLSTTITLLASRRPSTPFHNEREECKR